MDDAEIKIKLTSRESIFLVGLLLGVSVAYGVILSHLYDLSFLVGIVLSLFLGPGTWFWALGRFGVRGRERVEFIRGSIGLFNLLGSFISLLTLALIYVLHSL
jgi:hypothetical protein